MKRPPFDMEERIRLIGCGTINSQLPIKAGETTWNNISAKCAKCDKEIPDDLLRGEVHPAFTGVYRLKAVGYCFDCELVTCFEWNIAEDRVSGRNAEGKYVTWKSKFKRPIWKRLLDLFK